MTSDVLTYHFLVAVLPLIVSGILHMLIVKYDLLKMLSLPVFKPLFGANKTWRGIIFMAAANAVFLGLIKLLFGLELNGALLLGANLGLAYVLFELPNSFMKRRLGIPPGQSSKKNKSLFQLIDKVDSSLGTALVYYWLGRATVEEAVFVLIIGILVHMLISLLLVQVGIKKEY